MVVILQLSETKQTKIGAVLLFSEHPPVGATGGFVRSVFGTAHIVCVCSAVGGNDFTVNANGPNAVAAKPERRML